MSRPKRAEKPFAGNISTPSVAWLSPLDADTTSSSESVVKLVEIHLPQQQPRRYFDPDALKELVSSVRQHGILQPLLVRPLQSGGYELVAGERRYLAATEVGLTEVPVTVRELTNEEAFQFALIENLQRADLTPIEETEGILQLLSLHLEQNVDLVPTKLRQMFNSEFRIKSQTPINPSPVVDNNVIINPEDFTNPPVTTELDLERQQIEQVFKSLGLMSWESFVTNRLPLLNLPKDILAVLRSGQIAYTKAKALSQVKDEKSRTQLLKKALDNNWSLNEIKAQIKALLPKREPIELQQRFETSIRQAKKVQVWSDPNKQARLEALLAELDLLIKES